MGFINPVPTLLETFLLFRTSTKDTSAFQHVGSGSFCEDGGDLLEGRQKPKQNDFVTTAVSMIGETS